MSNTYFQFKQFTVHQDKTAMKVTTDACLFGAWAARNLKPGARSLLDVGTGTGLLALMLAQGNNSSIDAIEIDKDAFEQASANVTASRWKDRINTWQGDANLFSFPRKYDAIISNPPFYEKELKGEDSKKNMAHHDAGLLLPELLEVIKGHLEPNGHFYLLLPFKRNDEIRRMLVEQELALEQITFVKQTVNHDHFRVMIAGKLNSTGLTETLIDEVAIKDEKGEYTPAFKSLLKEYYLHL